MCPDFHKTPIDNGLFQLLLAAFLALEVRPSPWEPHETREHRGVTITVNPGPFKWPVSPKPCQAQEWTWEKSSSIDTLFSLFYSVYLLNEMKAIEREKSKEALRKCTKSKVLEDIRLSLNPILPKVTSWVPSAKMALSLPAYFH